MEIPRCFLCPQIKGILKKVSFKGKEKEKWAHIQCINWHAGVDFTSELREEVKGQVAKARFTLTCLFCHKVSGACL